VQIFVLCHVLTAEKAESEFTTVSAAELVTCHAITWQVEVESIERRQCRQPSGNGTQHQAQCSA